MAEPPRNVADAIPPAAKIPGCHDDSDEKRPRVDCKRARSIWNAIDCQPPKSGGQWDRIPPHCGDCGAWCELSRFSATTLFYNQDCGPGGPGPAEYIIARPPTSSDRPWFNRRFSLYLSPP